MKYRIDFAGDGNLVVGEKIQTRGDDERFPTFVLEDGSVIGVAEDRVGDPVQEGNQEVSA
jgi:hypothetical protein